MPAHTLQKPPPQTALERRITEAARRRALDGHHRETGARPRRALHSPREAVPTSFTEQIPHAQPPASKVSMFNISLKPAGSSTLSASALSKITCQKMRCSCGRLNPGPPPRKGADTLVHAVKSVTADKPSSTMEDVEASKRRVLDERH